jgi:hypothetical protein
MFKRVFNVAGYLHLVWVRIFREDLGYTVYPVTLDVQQFMARCVRLEVGFISIIDNGVVFIH